MESEKHYFLEGLFIIVLAVAAAAVFVWLSKTGHRDDVLYRINIGESVSGLAEGDPVKFNGVDVGNVKVMALDHEDPNRVRVDVALRKDAPIKTDTKASLRLKGLTGVVFIELDGGSPDAKRLVEATPAGQIPEIKWEKSTLTTVMDAIPKLVENLSSIGGQTRKVLGEVNKITGNMKAASENVKETTEKVKENPSLLLRRPKKKD